MPTRFTHCIVRGAQAEHAAATLHRGHRVIVLGQLRLPSSAYRGGRKGKIAELGVVEVALSLRYTHATLGVYRRPEMPVMGARIPTPICNGQDYY